MENHANNLDHPATQADLKILTEEFKGIFATKADLDNGLVSIRTDLGKDIDGVRTDLGKDIAAVRADLGKLEEKMEQLFADQADVILEAVDEKLDQKLDEKLEVRLAAQSTALLTEMDARLDKKFDTAFNKLDGILGSVEVLKQENTIGAEQLRRHDDKLENHEKRLKTLELHPQQ